VNGANVIEVLRPFREGHQKLAIRIRRFQTDEAVKRYLRYIHLNSLQSPNDRLLQTADMILSTGSRSVLDENELRAVLGVNDRKTPTKDGGSIACVHLSAQGLLHAPQDDSNIQWSVLWLRCRCLRGPRRQP
jgi:hypothetical protein